MKIIKNIQKKTMTSAIAILLIFSVAVTLFALPNANAASTGKAYPFIDAVPNPAGINQATLLNVGALNFLNAENDGWNVTITITKPDGKTETLGPIMTWSTGTAGRHFFSLCRIISTFLLIAAKS